MVGKDKENDKETPEMLSSASLKTRTDASKYLPSDWSFFFFFPEFADTRKIKSSNCVKVSKKEGREGGRKRGRTNEGRKKEGK